MYKLKICRCFLFLINYTHNFYTYKSLQENNHFAWAKNGRKSEKMDAYASEYRPFRIRRKKHGSKYKLAWVRKLDASYKGDFETER